MQEEDLKKIEIMIEKRFTTYLAHLSRVFDQLKDIRNYLSSSASSHEMVKKTLSSLELYVKPMMSISIDEFNLSIRTMNVLKTLKIQTMKDLCSLHQSEFLRVKNCGKHTFMEITKLLHSHGLDFKPWD